MKKVFITALALLVSFFISCSSRSKGDSFTAILNSIDNCISQGNVSDAMTELKRAQKHSYSSFERIAVYKRYKILGENELARKVIERAYKSLPENNEICAVYADILISENDYTLAASVAKNLADTPYSSVLAEAVLSEAFYTEFSSAGEDEKKLVFQEERFVPVYLNAWNGSKDSRWIMNAAAVYLKRGNFEKAVSLFQDGVNDGRSAVFWAKVFYDSRLFAESLDVLKTKDISYATGADYAEYFEALSLESDLHYLLEDYKSSALCSKTLTEAAASVPETDESVRSDLANAYVNLASYAFRENNELKRYEYVSEALEKFPVNERVLACYSDFALDLAAEPPESELIQKLRQVGLKTLSMEKKDSIPAVYAEDALLHITQAAESEKAAGRDFAALSVLAEKLYSYIHESEGPALLLPRVWTFLENSESNAKDGTFSYPEPVVRYAVEKLSAAGNEEDAGRIFDGYIYGKYGAGCDFSDCELWEREYAAWFASKNNVSEAFSLYDAIQSQYGKPADFAFSPDTRKSVIRSLVNMAAICEDSGEASRALEYLNKASSITPAGTLKAEILYRTACVQYENKQNASAIRSLQYALSLNPSHRKAALYLRKIQSQRQ